MREPAEPFGTATGFAPGRINLIGEHTDYNGGLVLPVALALGTTVTLRPRTDDTVRLTTDAAVELAQTSYVLGAERRGGGWTDHIGGITAALRRSGARVGGFDARIATTLPLGAGLASSAALGVALLRALRAAFALSLDDLALARLAHASESGFVGARVGLMDQLAAVFGRAGHATLIDLRDVSREDIALPELELAVIDSGTRHEHASSGYNIRRAECEAACRHLGVATLRELEDRPLEKTLERLPPPLDRRVRHVLTENARVRDAVAALRARELVALGALLCASQRSLREDYEVSTPELDRLVAILTDDPDVLGARLVGGGFGGSVLALTHAGRARPATLRALERYRSGRLLALVP